MPTTRILDFFEQPDCGHYHRMICPARYCGDILKAEGITFQLSKDIADHDLKRCKVVVFEGVTCESLIGKVSGWQHQYGTKIIWSVDDDFRCLPEWNAVRYKLAAGGWMGGYRWGCKNADFILTTGPHLASTFGDRKHVYHAPNLLECQRYTVYNRKPVLQNGERRKLKIVWAGSPTHLGDTEMLTEPITEILTRYPGKVEFLFFGEIPSEIMRRHWTNGVRELPYVRIDDYHAAVTQLQPDIWLAPLSDCEFNWSRSTLKPIEGMALGAATIASVIRTYDGLIDDGQNGVYASTPDEWTAAMSRLIEDDALRDELAANGHAYVQENWNWGRAKCLQPWLDFYRAVAKECES